MIRFSKSTMSSTAKALRKNLKAGKGYLSSIKMKDMDGKVRTISKPQYMGLFEAQNIFIRKNGRYPNYVTLNSTAKNPLVIDYQDKGTTCGPTSLSMGSQMLFGYTSEQSFAKACGTGSSGTDTDQLVAGAKSKGYKLTKINRKSAAVRDSLKKGFPVVAHIDTKPASCLGYINNYGHWVLIYGMNSEKYYVADPTKGLKKCKFSVLDKAMLGRTINYYSMSIL